MIKIAGWPPTLVFATLAGHLAAVTAVAGDREDCFSTFDKPDAVIEGCAGFITSGLGTEEELAAAYEMRAYVYLSRKEFDRALLEITEAIRRAPSANHYLVRSDAFYGKGDFRAALADIEKLIELDPVAGKYHLIAREFFRIKVGEFDRAIAGLKTLRDGKNDGGLGFYFGLAYAGKGDHVRAIADYDDAVRSQVDPADGGHLAEIHRARAASYEALGDLDKALADYQQAVKFNASEAGAAEGVARVEAVRVAVSAMSSATQFLDGAGRDPVQAYRWFDIAARFFPPGVRRDKAIRARDELARTMTPADLVAAQR